MNANPANSYDDYHEIIEQYFNQLFMDAWIGIESLLTRGQIENDVSKGFIHGLFVGTALACIQDDDLSERPNIVARRAVLYAQYGGLQGVIGELIRRMDYGWQYVPGDQRTEDDWREPDLTKVLGG
jgi:hypothetical protein